jgi:hypothetical protein
MVVIAGLGPARADEFDTPESLGIGPLAGFESETAARAHCPRDVVVWADRWSGYYHRRSEQKYGHTPTGVFACLGEAVAAHYWDTNPFAGDFGGRGRSFPINPDLLKGPQS